MMHLLTFPRPTRCIRSECLLSVPPRRGRRRARMCRVYAMLQPRWCSNLARNLAGGAASLVVPPRWWCRLFRRPAVNEYREAESSQAVLAARATSAPWPDFVPSTPSSKRSTDHCCSALPQYTLLLPTLLCVATPQRQLIETETTRAGLHAGLQPAWHQAEPAWTRARHPRSWRRWTTS